ncbi:MAG: TonB-dependent receptor [Pseudomonadales bacterium]|nr:TonB-dependent receptor [Pseudomonadales bacterium]MCP5172047.1 TonB-dependent receptor [Pseudomonadales bacterium]
MTFKSNKSLFLPNLLAISVGFTCSAIASDDIHEIVVTSDFRETSILSAAASLTVIPGEKLQQRAALHLENVLNSAPNVNTSSGASRGRFFQIRGIGERSQFKEPLDSSVGLAVDGVDFSNIGLAGGVFDASQVEVLRGPQGTRFGSSAMAGLINIQTAEPTEDFGGSVSGDIGNYNSRTLGIVLSGPLSEQLLGRIAVQKHKGDGYVENDFLGREDTNGFDELLVRAKLRWLASDDMTVDFTVMHLDVDNGYDAFSLDHNRHTRSDEPGHDRQESTAFSVKSTWSGYQAFAVETQLSYENTDLEYGLDWDWSDWATVGVRGFENNARDRDAASFDLRLLSHPGQQFLGADWVTGLYIYDRSVDLAYSEDADYYGAWTDGFESTFDTRRYAVYGQMDWMLSDSLNLSLGSRLERFENEYGDSYGVVGDNADNLWGGKLALEYKVSDDSMLYVSVSRGYKTGGINTDAMGKALVGGDPALISLLTSHFIYQSETTINYELGLKGLYLDGQLMFNATAFYMDRLDMQAKVALEISTANWTSYRDNIDGGENYGIEVEASWQLTDDFVIFASVGLLESELGDLTIIDVDTSLPVNQSGRDQAHAPSYQYNVGATYTFLEGFALTFQVDGKDEFYFSNSHDQRSDAIELFHLNFSYTVRDLKVSLWGRNLTDEDYQVRGFYWANNPNNGWINESYTQLGEPRVFGISAAYNF